MLVSDVHFDSKFCDRELYKAHLELAKRENMMVWDGGDFFDVMQGRNDRRRRMTELRPEYLGDDMFDRVVYDAADFLSGYPIVMMAPGNHELSVLREQSISLTDRLAHELRHDHEVVTGGFRGHIRLQFVRPDGRLYNSVLVYYSHYSGRRGSLGIAGVNKQAAYQPDALVVWNGDNHNGWKMVLPRERVSTKGEIFTDVQLHINTPGYKRDLVSDPNGFAALHGMGPKPVGCAILEFVPFEGHIAVSSRELFS